LKAVLSFITGVLFTISAWAQAPVANFTGTPLSGCAPLNVSFTDQSSNTPTGWTWDFGNGQVSNLQNPSTIYTTPGVYTVTLIARNASGTGSERKTAYITVFASPTVNFSASRTVVCAPGFIQFTDASTPGAGSITQWAWDFGDGQTSNQQNPNHTYNSAGFYTVTLRVTNSNNCQTELKLQRYIRVIAGITPQFTFNQTSLSCAAPFAVSFLNQTSGPGTLSYNWDLGNAQTSTATDPATTYPTSTNYTVILSVQSSFGCAASIQKIISFPTITTNFTGPDTVCVAAAANFQNTSAPAPTTNSWNFGDGSTSTVANPTKTYPTAGLYSVKLVNQYATCIDSITKNIRVIDRPTPDFTAVNTIACRPNLTTNFTDITVGGVSWLWNFGDGGTSTLQNPAHTYTTQGEFDVTLTVTNAAGCSNTITKPKFVRITRPVPAINGMTAQGCVPFNFSPVANVNAVDGVASYFWDFGDAGATSTSPTPSHTYNTQGNYTVKLRVTTNGGCTDSVTYIGGVRVGNVPVVDFSAAPLNVCAQQSLSFTDLSNVADAWLWNFGDGNTSNQQNPTHSYADTGRYTVSLTATNNGCAVTTTKTSYIHSLPPVARFNYTVNCSATLQVSFRDSSATDLAYGPITYLWEFGDPGNTTSTAANPIFTYPAYGSYIVKLTVTNGSCSNIIQRTVTLSAEIADFNAASTTICRTNTFTLNAITSNPANIRQYEWQIGGFPPVIAGRTYTGSLPFNGVFDVRLTITDSNGCVSTKTVPNYLTVIGNYANFSVQTGGGCKNKPITFTDLSTTDGINAITNWRFVFGDGQQQIFTAPPFTHAYADTGTYTVQLFTQDAAGCFSSVLLIDTVKITALKAGFLVPDSMYCPNVPLQFTDSSKVNPTSFFWDFGDGTTSTLQNPTHTYTSDSARYTIKLVVDNGRGCRDSVIKNNFIYIKQPVADFDMIDSISICAPLQTKFIFKGRDYDSSYWDFGDGETSTLLNTDHFYNNYNTYTARLIVRGRGGCYDTASRNVQLIDPFANTIFNFTPTQSCDSAVVTFNATPPPGTSFRWVFGDNNFDSTQRRTLQYTYKILGSYTPRIELKDSTGCYVVVGNGQDLKVIGAVAFYTKDKKEFCDTGTVNFTDFIISNDTITSFIWNFGDGGTAIGVNNPTHRYTTGGTYYPSLTVNTISGCSNTYLDTVRVFTTPAPDFVSTAPVCIGTDILFNAFLAQPDSVTRWQWNFGNGQTSVQQNNTIRYAASGNYTVTLSAANLLGCADTTSRSITVNALPVINVTSPVSAPLGIPVRLPAVYSSGIVSYNWTPPTDLSCTNCPNPFAMPKFNTTYRVAVTDNNGCVSTASIDVFVSCNSNNYFIPNTFSPNGDGMNDRFYVRGTGINRIQTMRIFNRWGQMVFEKRFANPNNAADGWDGTFKGKPADADTYIYMIDIICENAQIITYKGDVTLIR
jgi:gliding motility-associated-like protein